MCVTWTHGRVQAGEIGGQLRVAEFIGADQHDPSAASLKVSGGRRAVQQACHSAPAMSG